MSDHVDVQVHAPPRDAASIELSPTDPVQNHSRPLAPITADVWQRPPSFFSHLPRSSPTLWFNFCSILLFPPLFSGPVGKRWCIYTRGSTKQWSTLSCCSKCLFFSLLFNWSVLWRWELFFGEADFISTCKCPGMLAERERLTEKGILEELSLINACQEIIGCDISNWVKNYLMLLFFPDKTCSSFNI